MILRVFFYCFIFFSFDLVAQTNLNYEPILVVPDGHVGGINSVKFSDDGKFIVTTSDDGAVRIFDYQSKFELRKMRFKSHDKSAPIDADFIDQDSALAVLTSKSFFYLGDKNFEIKSKWLERFDSFFYMEDDYLIIINSGKSFLRYDFRRNKLNKIKKNHFFNLSSSNRYFLKLKENEKIKVIDIVSRKKIFKYNSSKGCQIVNTKISNNGDILFIHDNNGAFLYDLKSQLKVVDLLRKTSVYSNLVFSRDDSLLCLQSEGRVSIWKAPFKSEFLTQNIDSDVLLMDFSPDNRYVTMILRNDSFVIWDLLLNSTRKSNLSATNETISKWTIRDVNYRADRMKVSYSPSCDYILVWAFGCGHLYHLENNEVIRFLGELPQWQPNSTSFAFWNPRVMNELNALGFYSVSKGHSDTPILKERLGINSSKYLENQDLILQRTDDNRFDFWSPLEPIADYLRDTITDLRVVNGKVVADFQIPIDGSCTGLVDLNQKIVQNSFVLRTSQLIWIDSSYYYFMSSIKDRLYLSKVSVLNSETGQSSICDFDRNLTLMSGKFLVDINGGIISFYDVTLNHKSSHYINGKYIKLVERENDDYIYCFTDNAVHFFNVRDAHYEFSKFLNKVGVIDVFLSQKSTHMAVLYSKGNVQIIRLSDNKIIHEIHKKNQVQNLKFSPDGHSFFTLNKSGELYAWSFDSDDENVDCQGKINYNDGVIVHFEFMNEGSLFYTVNEDNITQIWNTASLKCLFSRVLLTGGDWLVYDEYKRFDGSLGAIKRLGFVCGLEPIELGQMKDALYVPGLASKIMNGEDINYKKLSDLDICGALPIIEKTNESPNGWEFSIEQRRWPIVRLEVMVDGKTVKTIAPDQLKFVNAKATLRLTRTDLQQHLQPGEENRVSVIAITENDKREFKSRGVQIELEGEGEKQDPNLYMLMIGVNDYKDEALDLRFPVQDARAFGSALESSARKLLGGDKVFVYNVQSKTDNTAVYTTPERAGVMKALEDIGKKAKTNDVLFIFFAGHGVMQGADNTFTFLTADASKLNPVGISTTDLKSWLSPEGPFHMMPNKTVLVYDACNSGQAAKEIMADLAMARDNDATERQRQIEDLGDKQGVFILSASAPNQSAYELPHLGQGMLTYSLLTTLKNNPGVLDEDKNGKGFLNLQKWFLETEREQSRLMQSLGLNQDAQPYGTANIRIGVVDDEVRNGIALMAEKPLVYCSNARDDNEEDPLELKQAVNTYLETATTRGTSSKLRYIKAETTQAYIVKLVYNTSGDMVQCRILIFKNKVKMNELNITTTPGKAAEEVVKAVEAAIK